MENNSKYISGPAQFREMMLVVFLVTRDGDKYVNKWRSKRFKPFGNFENISDWLIKSAMGFGFVEINDNLSKIPLIKLTKQSERLGENFLKIDEFKKYFIDMEAKLRKSPESKLTDTGDTEFFGMIDKHGLTDSIIQIICNSINFNILQNFWKEFSIIEKDKFKKEFWQFVNKDTIIEKSNTAQGADNRVPATVKIYQLFSLIQETIINGRHFYKNNISPENSGVIYELIEDDQNKNNIEYSDKIITSQQTVRTGQAYFRTKLLTKHSICAMCNISEPSLLRAGHIKEHYKCSPDEKYDIDNGILLCGLHDLVFEKTMVCYNKDGDILFDDFTKKARTDLNILKTSLTDGYSPENKYFEYKRKVFEEIHKNN